MTQEALREALRMDTEMHTLEVVCGNLDEARKEIESSGEPMARIGLRGLAVELPAAALVEIINIRKAELSERLTMLRKEFDKL